MRIARTLAIVGTLAVIACDLDRTPVDTRVEADEPPSLALEPLPPVGDTARYTLRLSEGAPVVGAFRLALHADTSRLTLVGATPADRTPQNALVVANTKDDRVLVAGASADGFSNAVFLVTFVRRGAETVATPRIEIMELAGLGGGDLRSAVRATPATARGPGGGLP